MPPALTSLSHGAGCGCKLSAADLRPIVAGLPRSADPRVLVATDTADDAGVVKLTDELAIVQTADFFTPIVDDPYAFGRIAATNALSDIYAMGGVPVSALNLVAYPLATLGPEILAEILRGGADAVAAAGASVVGGHSIDDPEPKYGLAVTGTVHPDRVLMNSGGREGDTLVLTKPLGAGAVATAIKRGLANEALVARAIEVMTTLNDRGAEHGARRGGARADRRHGLRPARPPARARGGERPRGRDRRRRRARDRRRPRPAGRRGGARGRLQAQPGGRRGLHALGRRGGRAAAAPAVRRDDQRRPARRDPGRRDDGGCGDRPPRRRRAGDDRRALR